MCLYPPISACNTRQGHVNFIINSIQLLHNYLIGMRMCETGTIMRLHTAFRYTCLLLVFACETCALFSAHVLCVCVCV